MLTLALVAGLLAPVPAPKKPTAAQARAQAAAFKTALAEGRKASKAGDHPTAIRHLQAAVKIKPNDPAAQGELGWAQYKAGQLAAGELSLTRGLMHTRDPKLEGMLRYNLGRILEDEGKLAEAWEAYRLSLARRDNATVKARLASLEARKGEPKRATLEDLCVGLRSLWNCGTEEDQLACKCAPEKIIEAEAAATDGAAVTSAEGHTEFNRDVILRAALLKIEGDSNGSLDARHLAVETGTGGWQHVELVVEGWSPGVGYIHNHGELVDFKFEDRLSTGMGELLVVQVKNTYIDGQYGDNVMDFDERETLYLCHGAEGRPSCAALDLSRAWGVDKMIDNEPHTGKLSRTHYALSHSFSYNAITLSPKAGKLPKDLASVVGKTELDKLTQRPGWKPYPLR